jgi:excisionase family DNA binding protein
MSLQTHSHRICLRINDAADSIGIGRSALYKLIGEKKLRAIKIGGRSVIEVVEIQRLIREAAAAT